MLDFLLEREPHSEYADKLFDLFINKELNGFIAAHSISDIFYILRKFYSADERRKMLLEMCNLVDIVGIGKYEIFKSLMNFDFKDFEDCLQMECAVECNADYIITRNIKDFAQSSVPPITAEDFIKLIDKR